MFGSSEGAFQLLESYLRSPFFHITYFLVQCKFTEQSSYRWNSKNSHLSTFQNGFSLRLDGVQPLVARVMFAFDAVIQTHTALDVLQFWQNVQGEAVCLPSGPITSVHEVTKSQHQAEHLRYTRTALQRLMHTRTHKQRWRHEGQTESRKRTLSEQRPSGSPCTLSQGFLICGRLRWYIRGKSTETGCRTLVHRSWGFVITGIETWRRHRISGHDI